MRAVALCDVKNGKTDAEQFSAQMELLERNPDMESRPNNEMAEVVKQFFKLSNETEDSDGEFKAGDHGDFGTLDVLRSIAICYLLYALYRTIQADFI